MLIFLPTKATNSVLPLNKIQVDEITQQQSVHPVHMIIDIQAYGNARNEGGAHY